MVVVDVQMSETAMLADYVLPECSYLERRELPEFVGGRVPVVSPVSYTHLDVYKRQL